MPTDNHMEPSDLPVDDATMDAPQFKAENTGTHMMEEVEAVSDDLAAQLQSITQEFDAVRKELDRINMEAVTSMSHLPKLVDDHLKELQTQAKQGKKGVIRRHSAYNSQGKVPKPAALQRSISWDPEVRDNAKRPGEDSLSDKIRRQSFRNRRRRQRPPERPFMETIMWCLAVVIISNFLPQILQSFIALGSSGNLPTQLDD